MPRYISFCAFSISESAIVLVGNKMDGDEEGKGRVVSFEEAKKWADERSLEYFEASAKTGVNVAEVCFALSSQTSSSLLPSTTIGFSHPQIRDPWFIHFY